MPNASQYYDYLNTNDVYMLIIVLSVTFIVLTVNYFVDWKPSVKTMPLPDIRIIMLIALIIRIPFLFNSFWYDETFTSAIATLEFNELHHVIITDVHPPLHYLISWLVVRVFGNSDVLLRLPSLLFGLLSLVVLYRIAIITSDKRTAQLTVLIMALIPAHVYYSTEARGYSLLIFIVWFGLLAVLENKPHRFILISLSSFVHVYGLVFVFVSGVGALFYHRDIKRWLMPVMITGAIAAIWLPFAIVQSGDVVDGFWLRDLTLPGVLWYVYALFAGTGTWIAIISLMVVTIVSLKAIQTKQHNYLLAVFIAIPVLMALISWLLTPIYLVRALLPASLLIVLFWSKGLQKSPLYQYGFVLFTLVSVITLQARKDIKLDILACGDRPVYAVELSSGFIAKHYTKQPVLLYSDYNNLNQGLPPSAIKTLDFVIVDHPPHDSCIVSQLNPMMTENQKNHLISIMNDSDVIAHNTFNEWYEFMVYSYE